MLLHDDSCRSKWGRLCKQATAILTKYESNVFFVFVICVCFLGECIFKRGGDRRHGNINYRESECSMDKLEAMQWSVV